MGVALEKALRRDDLDVYIVTTKQTRYVVRILSQLADIDFPDAKVISSTVSGIPKATAINELMEKHADVSSWHFVEDRFETLDGMPAASEMRKDLRMYLADWGYNVQRERDAAAGSGSGGSARQIDLIDLDTFCNLLESGFA